MIDSVFYGIKWSHDGWGSLSNSDNSVVEAFRSASKRILGTATVNRKEPISSDLIHTIVNHVNLMYVLCFTGFFSNLIMIFPELEEVIFLSM